MRTIAWKIEANTVVLVHGANDPADPEWTEYLEALRAGIHRGERLRVLVVTPGSGPNMRQRKELNEVFQGMSTPTAVVTSSTVGRAVVTLLALRNPDIRAFEPGRMSEAFEYLSIPPPQRERLQALVDTLRAEVGLASVA